MKITFKLCIAALLLNSCDTVNKSVNETIYFNVDSLIDSQIRFLLETKASLSKKAVINLREDVSLFTPDSIGWANELAVFRHLDIINKPTYKDAYEILDNAKDTNSNLTVRTYRPNRETPLSDFQLYYLGSVNHLKRVEATLKETNALYSTLKQLRMDFEESNSQSHIIHYELAGTQKMILSDTVNFLIQSTVVWE